MVTLLSSWSNGSQTLPETYVLPPEKRPGDSIAPTNNNNPVVDLSHDPVELAQQILKASQEFGFFQVVNHGVSGSLMDDAMNVFNEFFGMLDEVKESVFTVDSSKSCRLYTSSFNYATEEFHYWRDNLTHPCHPFEDCMQLWPKKPARYIEVVGAISGEVRKLVMRILDLICEGLGMEQGYFGDKLSKTQLLSVNHYPKCPNPSLTLGIARHCDPNLISIVHQGGVYGLQVFKDDKWIGVEPNPNAFVVIIGCQLQIITNERIRSAEHRVVTNSEKDRTSIGYFFVPCHEYPIEPAKALVNNVFNPPLYRSFQYKHFLSTYAAKMGVFESVMECYKLQS